MVNRFFGVIYHLYLEAIFYLIKTFKRSSTRLECEKCSKNRQKSANFKENGHFGIERLFNFQKWPNILKK